MRTLLYFTKAIRFVREYLHRQEESYFGKAGNMTDVSSHLPRCLQLRVDELLDDVLVLDGLGLLAVVVVHGVARGVVVLRVHGGPPLAHRGVGHLEGGGRGKRVI